MISIEEKKLEAIKRMKMMKLSSGVIKDFERYQTLYYSEIMGILYWISNNPEWVDYIQNFEIKYDALVYHAEFSYLQFGKCLTLFYVSDYEEEWEQDRDDLKEGYSLCFVWNTDYPDCSEFGSIVFKPLNGGVKRIG